MKISETVAMWGCVVFALVCYGAAFTVFSALAGSSNSLAELVIYRIG